MISDAKIKAAIKSVVREVTLTDKSQARGGGSLILVVRRLADGNVSAQWFAQVKRDGKRTKWEAWLALTLAEKELREDIAA